MAQRITNRFPATAWPRVADRLLVPASLLLAAMLLRVPQLGNPIAGLDEQFYLLVGERMWQGAMPYVDIWDRKPAGLFLLYALFAALPGDALLAYQLAGTLSLAATGWITVAIARRMLPRLPSAAAGLAVIVYGAFLGEGFGEAPIFYDPLIAGAAWLLLEVLEKPRPGGIDHRALFAMLLCGTALTIKTTAVFESCAFGLLLLNADRTMSWSSRIRRALAYLAAGLLPTAAIAAAYAATGAFDAFWFANFVSVFRRSGGFEPEHIAGLAATGLLLAPLLLPALAELRSTPSPMRSVLLAWLVATAAGFLALGYFHFHYALPLVTPLALLAARAIRHRLAGLVAVAALLLVASGLIVRPPGDRTGDRTDIARLAAAIPADVRTRCLFVHEGPVILYQLTQACLPGRYVFPGHFTAPHERDALEQPSHKLLRETLARRPFAIVSVPALRDGKPSTLNDRILAAELARNYRPVARQSVRLYGTRRVEAVVWVDRRPHG